MILSKCIDGGFMTINGEKYNAERYSSGEMKLKKSILMKYVKNSYVNILYKNDLSIFELLLILSFYKSQGVKIELTLAYLPYQRMDHNENEEVEIVKFVAQIFNSLKLEKINICEPHCSTKYFNNANAIGISSKILEIAKNEIGFNDRDVIYFTDKGSKEKFGNINSKFAYGQKERDKTTGYISSYKIVGNIAKNQRVIIIDDIIS